MLKRKNYYILVLFLICLLSAWSSFAYAKSDKIDLIKSTIYVDGNADHIKQFAAHELQKHLKLITGATILITHDKKTLKYNKFTFMIGVKPPKNLGLMAKFAVEEACYLLDERLARLYFFGDDFIESRYTTPRETCAYSRNRVGTLFAVYDFLNLELGVRWIKPGDGGISYSKRQQLKMRHKFYRWTPRMLFRGWRTEAWNQNVQHRFKFKPPTAMRLSNKKLAAKRTEELIWQRRLKFGKPNRPGYGHAFTKYWGKYGKLHPEWFALGKNGKRGVYAGQKADRLKFCVSNPQLLDAIVAEWRSKWRKNKNYDVYNACPNDSQGYCRCKKCCALDGVKQTKNESFEKASKSDRYVYFWNELLKRARKFNPQAKLIVYIYADYRYPPHKQTLADGIICGFVPRFRDLPVTTGKEWAKWKKRGMKEVFLRPNDFNDSIGMPMGNSRYIYDKFALAKGYKLVGSDYDRAYNALDAELNGLAFYILAQAFNYPDKSYESLANEFYATFGNAKTEIRNYYRYWIKLFTKKRLAMIQVAGGFEGRRYLFNNLANFYQTKDFINAHQILLKALKNDLPLRIRKNIDSIILANEHSKLLYQAITCTTIEEKAQATEALFNFRLKNQAKLSSSLTLMFGTEASFDDIAGIKNYVINSMHDKKNSHLVGENMVKNGDFDQGSKNWSIPQKDNKLFNFYPALANKNAYLKIIGARIPDGYSRISNLITGGMLKYGDDVIIKAKVKCDKLTGKFEIMLRQADNKNKSLRYSGFSFSKCAAFGWKSYSKKVKIKARAVSFYVYLIATNLASDDAVYVTDITIEKIER